MATAVGLQTSTAFTPLVSHPSKKSRRVDKRCDAACFWEKVARPAPRLLPVSRTRKTCHVSDYATRKEKPPAPCVRLRVRLPLLSVCVCGCVRACVRASSLNDPESIFVHLFLSCSKCGALPPESCFFSLICSIGSFMGKADTHTHTKTVLSFFTNF